MSQDEQKNAGATPSGPKDDNAQPGKEAGSKPKPEDLINPSAPEDANTTPGPTSRTTGEKKP